METTKTLITILSESFSNRFPSGRKITFTAEHPVNIRQIKNDQINLFPYYMTEDPNLRNINMIDRRGDEFSQNINYEYLVTAYNPESSVNSLILLEQVRQSYLDNSMIVSQEGNKKLVVTMNQYQPEFYNSLCLALQSPLQPSLSYSVKKTVI